MIKTKQTIINECYLILHPYTNPSSPPESVIWTIQKPTQTETQVTAKLTKDDKVKIMKKLIEFKSKEDKNP